MPLGSPPVMTSCRFTRTRTRTRIRIRTRTRTLTLTLTPTQTFDPNPYPDQAEIDAVLTTAASVREIYRAAGISESASPLVGVSPIKYVYALQG